MEIGLPQRIRSAERGRRGDFANRERLRVRAIAAGFRQLTLVAIHGAAQGRLDLARMLETVRGVVARGRLCRVCGELDAADFVDDPQQCRVRIGQPCAEQIECLCELGAALVRSGHGREPCELQQHLRTLER